MEDKPIQQQVNDFQRVWREILDELGGVIVGQQEVLQQVLLCLLAGGHALVEGVPGLAKTLLVRTLADVLDLSFSRIQFTPDLMPADITGTTVLAEGAGPMTFRFEPGPIFAHLVLADEINRATPKTQSAVLEAMAEQTVSVARTSHRLPAPFMVLATQNPIEMEGTYPLPEAQVDRFLLKIAIAMPSRSELVEIIDRTTAQPPPRPRKVADASQLLAMRELVRQVKLAGPLKDTIAAIVLATHPADPSAPPLVRRAVRYGASPRGAQGIALAAKVLALRDGRGHVSLDDIRAVAAPALRHRLVLSYEGQADGVEPDQIITEVMSGSMLNG